MAVGHVGMPCCTVLPCPLPPRALLPLHRPSCCCRCCRLRPPTGPASCSRLRALVSLVPCVLSLPQLLPLVPPETTYWSPYSGLDALCGNTLMIPVDELVGLGLLDAADRPAPQPVELHADFTAIAEWKVGWGGGAGAPALWSTLLWRIFFTASGWQFGVAVSSVLRNSRVLVGITVSE